MSDIVDLVGAASERIFSAMGTHAHVLVVGGAPELLERAVERVADLERRWSRFLPASDISRLNAAAGGTVAVSPETYLLVSRSVEACRLTDGLYDPTVLAALVAAGYDRSFTDPACAVHRVSDAPPAGAPSPGAAGIELEPTLRTVRLPVGVAIDPGGIGKGLAADLVVAELMASGAAGACVNLGGDVRVAGHAPTDLGWQLGVQDPVRPGSVVPVRLRDEAVVTSTRQLRRWQRAGKPFHHLIDPQTGRPATTAMHTVTIVAGQAWWAEVLAKVALVAPVPHALRLLHRAGVAALLADDEGRALELGDWSGRVLPS